MSLRDKPCQAHSKCMTRSSRPVAAVYDRRPLPAYKFLPRRSQTAATEELPIMATFEDFVHCPAACAACLFAIERQT